MSIGDLVPQTRALVSRETRDPTAATQSVRYTAANAPQLPEWDAENAIKQGYLANVVAYRCVQLYANTIAALPFRAGPDINKRSTFDTNAPLAKKLGPAPGGPAPKLSARKLFAWTIAQRLVTGRFAWELELQSGKGSPIVNLWPLPVSFLKAIPTDSGTEWFSSFTYGRSDKPRKLRPDQVFYDWEPGQSDFREPESALQSSRYDLSIAVMGDRYSYAFLKNGAVPAHVVVVDAFPDEQSYQRFKQNWRGEYQGPDNAGKVHIVEARDPEPGQTAPPLSESIYIQTLGVSQKDARFLEAHKEAMMNVAISLGVPWSKLDASGRTFDNAGHEDKTWWESSVLPIICDLEDAINMDLAPRFGSESGWFDLSYVEALKPGKKWVLTGADLLAFMNTPCPDGVPIISPNEIRCDQGLEELPELEDWCPMPMAPMAPHPMAPEMAPSAMPELEPPEGAMGVGDSAATGTGTGREKEPEARNLDIAAEVRRSVQWRSFDSTVKTLERQWEASMRRLFARQEKSVLSALHGKRGAKMFREPAPQQDAGNLFNPRYWVEQTADHASDLYATTTAAGAASVSNKFGVSFDVTSPHAQQFINNRSNQLAGNVTKTTYEDIQSVLDAAVENGDSIDDIASAIQHVFSVASDSRATTIARTETISAYNGSSQMAATDLGPDVVGGQEWIATQDGRTREEHSAADGQQTSIGDYFDIGGESLAYPGDPNGSAENTINCRCTVGFLTPDEMEARQVPMMLARAVLSMVQPGSFDASTTRRALMEAVA